ncbi:MAG: Mannose-1-phosphate guanylyltransferase 1 [Verrucomicrobiae bacterium]|nr:Mannose-1-phosphate guanylyltransferase 1 [Verrucomicrobiae bacterium]
MNWAVIMAGGVGERFWPMSRRTRPKQLLSIVGKRTMIQQTVARLRGVVAPSRMVVVTTADQVPLVRKQLPKVKHIIAEPVGRNTAPCVGLAAAIIGKHDPSAVMVVVPADSYIPDMAQYRRVVKDALEYAVRENVLITIGIQPASPHTGYGYVQLGESITGRISRAKRFVEKPDRATAEQFLASGEYLWNAGMFVWSVGAISEALAKHQPDIAAGCRAIQAAVGTPAFTRVLKREFAKMTKISIDYAVMEKAGNVVVAKGDFAWDDVGDWAAIERHQVKDDAGNATRGEFVGVDAKNCVIVNDTGKIITAVGVSDLVIVQTGDATLVCRKADSQRVREVVKQLATQAKYRKLL